MSFNKPASNHRGKEVPVNGLMRHSTFYLWLYGQTYGKRTTQHQQERKPADTTWAFLSD